MGLDTSGTTLIVGAKQESTISTGLNGDESSLPVVLSDANHGAAYLFEEREGTWSQIGFLKASNTEKMTTLVIQSALVVMVIPLPLEHIMKAAMRLALMGIKVIMMQVPQGLFTFIKAKIKNEVRANKHGKSPAFLSG